MAAPQTHRLHRAAARGTGEAVFSRQARGGVPRLDLQTRHLQRSRRRRRRSISCAGMTDSPDRTGYALVTGGGARLGATIVRRLAAEGWPVAIHYNRSGAAAEALTLEISSAGG